MAHRNSDDTMGAHVTGQRKLFHHSRRYAIHHVLLDDLDLDTMTIGLRTTRAQAEAVSDLDGDIDQE